jgi:hypothetical protein
VDGDAVEVGDRRPEGDQRVHVRGPVAGRRPRATVVSGARVELDRRSPAGAAVSAAMKRTSGETRAGEHVPVGKQEERHPAGDADAQPGEVPPLVLPLRRSCRATGSSPASMRGPNSPPPPPPRADPPSTPHPKVFHRRRPRGRLTPAERTPAPSGASAPPSHAGGAGHALHREQGPLRGHLVADVPDDAGKRRGPRSRGIGPSRSRCLAARLTDAFMTPSALESAFSTRATQDAQVIPDTGSVHRAFPDPFIDSLTSFSHRYIIGCFTRPRMPKPQRKVGYTGRARL